jgi:hypothetical protein
MTTVAVCIPTIPGREAMLQRATRSVAEQTRPVDAVDVALDSVGEGAASTRNRAWQMTSADWVVFLDDDDTFKPEHVEHLLGAAEDANADLVYPWFDIVNDVGIVMNDRDPLRIVVNGELVTPFGLPFAQTHVEELYQRNNFIPITVLVRRQLLEEVGGFPALNSPEWPENCCEDWALWRRLLDVDATFTHLPERTWNWMWHGRNTSGRSWRQTGV